MVTYEQKEPEQPIVIREYWLWNTRGRVVSIQNERDAKDALDRGFKRVSQNERKHFKPGDYFALYDQGSGVKKEQFSGYSLPSGITQPDSLEVIWV